MMKFLQDGKNIWIAILSLVVILLIGWTASLGGFSKNTSSNTTNANPTSGNEAVTQENRSVSGKTENEDKQDALKAAENVLNTSGVSPTGASVEDRVTALDNNDFSVIDKSLPNLMRFKGQFATDQELQASSYQALITLNHYIAKDGKVNVISDDMWQNVYVDQEAGIAYVPISVFFGQGSAFSLEMVYSDGEWKLAPYSLLDIVRLSASLQTGSSGQQTQG